MFSRFSSKNRPPAPSANAGGARWRTTFRWTGASLWFLLKVAIYLLVAYSIIFSITATASLFFLKSKVDQTLQSVEWLKENQPEESLYMEEWRIEQQVVQPEFTLEHRYVPLDSISPLLIRAVLASEDAGFYTHPGIDLESLLSAVRTNLERGKKSFGGSTITQQLAKNFFLSDEKSWKRKGLELVYSLLLEDKLGKERILELYLNYAQWGERQFGIEAAAQHYYHIPAKKLGFEQSVRLASILANPVRYNPHSKQSVFLSQRRGVIYNNLLSQRVIDSVTWAALKSDSVSRHPSADSVEQSGEAE